MTKTLFIILQLCFNDPCHMVKIKWNSTFNPNFFSTILEIASVQLAVYITEEQSYKKIIKKKN